ncbi:hypothetical protein Tco_0102081 [Tanacetum coccineum]
MDTELVKKSSKKAKIAQESSSKRAGDELQQKSSKKQKVDDDKEKEELKQCFEIVLEDEDTVEVIPLAVKPAPITNIVYIYMLVEKKYPLGPYTYKRMWDGKLQVDYECEMAYELLRFIKLQLPK